MSSANESEKTVFDTINRRTMRAAVREYQAIVHEELSTQERAAIDSVMAKIRDRPILDIGVGAGRTTRALLAISTNYLGVDYMQEMVDHCRVEFPGVQFQRGDARTLDHLSDGQFALVFFSCNGISMADHEGRLAILAEAHRVLAPGGSFIFSTCNRDSHQFARIFAFPKFAPTRHPLKLAFRASAFLVHSLVRAANRIRHLRHEVRTPQYAIINDVCHDYNTMLYFITLAAQQKQLQDAGFRRGSRCYNLSGQPVEELSSDGTLIFVCQK